MCLVWDGISASKTTIHLGGLHINTVTRGLCRLLETCWGGEKKTKGKISQRNVILEHYMRLKLEKEKKKGKER